MMAKGTTAKAAAAARFQKPYRKGQPTNAHRLQAATIVAEMMLHIGRGQAAAQLGHKGSRRIANNAGATIPQDVYDKTFKMFLEETAKSLAGAYSMDEWTHQERNLVLNLCVQMGYNAQLAATRHKGAAGTTGRAGGTGLVTYDHLKEAMRVLRDRHCPTAGLGGGATCPPDPVM